MTRKVPLQGLYRVRVVEGAFVMQCHECFEFWPLTMEFWAADRLRQCKACIHEARRKRSAASMRQRRADPVLRAQENADRRTKYRADVVAKRAYQADWWRRKRSTLARALDHQ